MKKIFPLKKQNNKFVFANENVAIEYSKDMAELGVDENILSAEIILKTYKKKRSLSANNYYWGVVLKAISEHLDIDPKELHYNILLPAFGPDVLSENKKNIQFVSDDGHVFGFEMRSVGSSQMTTAEFGKYTEEIKKGAALPSSPSGILSKHYGLGLYIPDPNTAMEYYMNNVHYN